MKKKRRNRIEDTGRGDSGVIFECKIALNCLCLLKKYN